MINEWLEELQDSAGEVDDLLIDSVNLAYFRSQIKRLCALVEARAKVIKPLMEQAADYYNQDLVIQRTTEKSRILRTPHDSRTIEQNERLKQIKQEEDKEKDCACPGDEHIFGIEPLLLGGYYKFETDFRWWLPQRPPNPLVWFPGYEKHITPAHKKSEHMEPHDKRMRDIVVLAAVHNWGCSSLHTKVKGRTVYGDLPYNGRFFERDKFLTDLLGKLQTCAGAKAVKSALKRVRDDREKGPGLTPKQPGSGGAGGGTPPDPITLSVAEQRYAVSKVTLRRAIKDPNHPLISHRNPKAAANTQHKVSEKVVSSKWPKRQK